MSSPAADHVWFFLESHPADPEALYLEIPLELIQSLCLNPGKYLRFLAYAILAVDGTIAHNQLSGQTALSDESQLEDGGIYIFSSSKVMTPKQYAEHRADMEVVRQRSQFGGSESARPALFVDGVYARDAVSFFKDSRRLVTQALHIVAHARGSPWLQHLISMRSDFEGGEDIDDIDHPRNGFCGETQLHLLFDGNVCAILKTPNHILKMDDIPSAPDCPLDDDSSYPTDARYTLQYLDQTYEKVYVPNNTDGAFKDHDPSIRPSMFLFHYRYGASALVRWGRGLEKCIPPSRPPKTTTVATDEQMKQRDLKKDEGAQGTSQGNASWTTQAVFEVYDPLDVLKMISPWYDAKVDEVYDQDVNVEECLHQSGFSDEIKKWRNTVAV
ncbi:hypothetical protein BT96DRAFT_916269 [Gymnopus androsaceus JB14]|uniref:HNH nuclease domain-containing protein n=1 Tax=Gymnopus androsaceus JB14 TaxID=1447944 RepID=A0A6A4I578_9AGAR|nr:hypothetical protein BT96DRAFT_916269 [Gymnopus androsaceus JB14]